MRDLLYGAIPFLWIHYNSTGTYWLGHKIGNATVYDFINDNQIKMSIVNFQTSVLADRETYSTTANGENVTSTETPVDDTSINTYADDGEKISSADFNTKQTYKLFNYTEDQTEQNYTVNEATARTAKAAGFARNTAPLRVPNRLNEIPPTRRGPHVPRTVRESRSNDNKHEPSQLLLHNRLRKLQRLPRRTRPNHNPLHDHPSHGRHN